MVRTIEPKLDLLDTIRRMKKTTGSEQDFAGEIAEYLLKDESDKLYLQQCKDSSDEYRKEYGNPMTDEQILAEVNYIAQQVPHGVNVFFRYLQTANRILRSGGEGSQLPETFITTRDASDLY